MPRIFYVKKAKESTKTGTFLEVILTSWERLAGVLLMKANLGVIVHREWYGLEF